MSVHDLFRESRRQEWAVLCQDSETEYELFPAANWQDAHQKARDIISDTDPPYVEVHTLRREVVVGQWYRITEMSSVTAAEVAAALPLRDSDV